jgi:hypothetical protein
MVLVNIFNNDPPQALVCNSRPDAAPWVRTPSLSETKKNKSSLPRMLIRPAPKQRGRSSVYPLSHRALSGCRAMPFPRHWPRRAPLLPTPLTYVPVTYAACSLAVYPSPIVVGQVVDPAMAARAHVSWCLRSSSTKPRAFTSVAGAGSARASQLAAGSHPNNRNRSAPAFPFPMLQMYVSDISEVRCNCYIWILQK